jgi:hypothetical protein
MQLAGHASAVVHPLTRVLDGPVKVWRCRIIQVARGLTALKFSA